MKPHTGICCVCKKEFKLSELFPAEMVRPSITALVHKDQSDWDGKGYICSVDLNKYRVAYITQELDKEKGDLTELEEEVIQSIKDHELMSENVHALYQEHASFGQRLADRIASFGGSWTFILIFMTVLFIWITVNVTALFARPFDPFPFILLNLVLSCIAAIQAPVIMMSQNRQEARDRMQAEHDYQVNLKAELEIRHLNERIDYLITHQWQRLIEIQQIQIEMLEHLRGTKEKPS